MEQLAGVEPLTAAHDTSDFDCGKPELTDWLRRYALVNHRARTARVFVVHRGRRVVGYYALAASSVERQEAPERVRKGLARHPIPVILLARLAVDQREQGKSLGAALLKDALTRAASAADEIGARAVLVHAKDEEARAFYERFDFEPSPTDPLHLFLLTKDLTRVTGGNR
ncbi:MAG: GNAT family N-acetyltransferase [Armatimonadota bacterium]